MRLTALLLLASAPALAQPRPPRTPGDTLKSPVVGENGVVTFQLYAPKATEVSLRTEGPAPFANQKLVRNEQGVWSATDTVPADLYIYWYDVDGVPVADPRNNATRLNLSTVRSLLEVPGAASDFFAERDVPHGQVATVWYRSTVLGMPRRMQIYTPPGYATSGARYPVFYLLHGAGDDDRSWLMAGRANFILDNLIAAGKAKPMIVVMPNGSVSRAPGTRDPYPESFAQEIVPYVERNFRVLPGRDARAIAGLSMGGGHTLAIALPNLDRYAYVGVFSSGFLGPGGADSVAKAYQGAMSDPRINRLKLLWLATGKEDFILPTTKATLAAFDRNHVRYTYKESEGGHTWPNWRAYLYEFAPQLFR
ncbi:esterase [Gemmatirosa kalamazoonensis]|uniref:Esterase n=1 Tax=Gemmatirosa kalamazoonensis TaxID=861299 RepID=W0RIK0_9BACT|nr:esterase [Gemmatirosa kalamazoonensis]AHG89213.1 esterase [Gemmatirosa kalamazoonensis]